MAIVLEFINVIIPINNIDRCKSIGGFEGYLELEGHNIGETIWYDDHLVREGAMNPMDVEDIIDIWAERGLNPVVGSGSEKRFKDLCVIDSFGGLTLPCNWIEFDSKEHVAWHEDKPRGKIVGPGRGRNEGILLVPSE